MSGAMVDLCKAFKVLESDVLIVCDSTMHVPLVIYFDGPMCEVQQEQS